MKILCLISLIISAFAYDRSAAVKYAYQYAKTPNHKCGSNYLKCSPCSYFGREACGYESHGGDCANFVSQCLVLGGGHPKFKQKGWQSTCGYHQAPPSNIKEGDVLIYHSSGCGSGLSHAVFITKGGSNPKITCHSSVKVDADYTYMSSSKPYYQWLHYNG